MGWSACLGGGECGEEEDPLVYPKWFAECECSKDGFRVLQLAAALGSMGWFFCVTERR